MRTTVTSSRPARPAIRLMSAAVAIASLALAGCAATPEPESTKASGEPVELTYWTWSAPTVAAIDIWNATHPDIRVTAVDNGNAESQPAKVIAAVKAGEGPDIFHNEYLSVPSMALQEIALDISDRVGDMPDAFTESVWDLVNVDGATYGVPVDVAPMAFWYREDILAAAGAEVPTTWDEYRETAEKIAALGNGTTMTVFPASNFSLFSGLTQQNGAQWWSIDDGEWVVDADSPAQQDVAEYWDALVDDGLVQQAPWYTPEWTQQIVDGEIATFVGGAWLTTTIGLRAAKPDLEKWRIAPLPVWSEGDPNGFVGGSAASIAASTKHPDEAMEFLTWLATAPEASAARSTVGEYPAAIVGQEQLSGSPKNGLAKGQDDYYRILEKIAADTASVTWAPNTPSVSIAYQDEVGRSMQAGTGIAGALEPVEEFAVADLKRSGYPVAQ